MRYSATTLPSTPRRNKPPNSPANRETKPQQSSKKRRLRWMLIAASMILCGFVAYVAWHWPYSQKVVLPAIEDTFKTQASVERFQRFYFPNPGCRMQGVVLAHPGNDPQAQPLATCCTNHDHWPLYRFTAQTNAYLRGRTAGAGRAGTSAGRPEFY